MGSVSATIVAASLSPLGAQARTPSPPFLHPVMSTSATSVHRSPLSTGLQRPSAEAYFYTSDLDLPTLTPVIQGELDVNFDRMSAKERKRYRDREYKRKKRAEERRYRECGAIPKKWPRQSSGASRAAKTAHVSKCDADSSTD
jgi:hypothetical protein